MATLAARAIGIDVEQDFADYFTVRAVPLRRLAYALCGDWYLAEDLVQNTFVKVYRHWGRIRAETLDAYTRRTLINTFLSDKRGRRREQILPDVPERAIRASDPTQAIDLRRGLATLSSRQRAMVVLRYLEDLSVAEVAATLGIAEGTVKSQTARGLQALRQTLDSTIVNEE